MDENSALRALCMRDEGALGWFIDRYTAYVATIVNNMLLPRLAASDAEEVVADVFLALWHNAANIRSGGVRAYLGAIARNKSRDALRALREELPLEDDVLSIPTPTPEQALTERELHERTRAPSTAWASRTGRSSCATITTARAWRTSPPPWT